MLVPLRPFTVLDLMSAVYSSTLIVSPELQVGPRFASVAAMVAVPLFYYRSHQSPNRYLGRVPILVMGIPCCLYLVASQQGLIGMYPSTQPDDAAQHCAISSRCDVSYLSRSHTRGEMRCIFALSANLQLSQRHRCLIHLIQRHGTEHGIRVSISATFLDATINRHAEETNRLHGWRHSVQVDQPPPLIHYALQHNSSRPPDAPSAAKQGSTNESLRRN